MNPELLDYLKDVKLLIKLALCIFEQVVVPHSLRSTAATPLFVEAPELPETEVLVGECLS